MEKLKNKAKTRSRVQRGLCELRVQFTTIRGFASFDFCHYLGVHTMIDLEPFG